MSVSRLRGKTPTIAASTDGEEAVPVPPFWELEALIAAGLTHEAALQVMAARRAALTLVGAPEPAEPRRFGLAS